MRTPSNGFLIPAGSLLEGYIVTKQTTFDSASNIHFDEQLNEKRLKLNRLVGAQNLLNLEIHYLNYFYRELQTLFPGIKKDWKPGQHCFIDTVMGHSTKQYRSLYATSFDTNQYFHEELETRLRNNTYGTIVMCNYPAGYNKFKLIDYGTGKTNIIEKKDNKCFLLDGKEIYYPNSIDSNGFDTFKRFAMVSLVGQMVKFMAPIARSKGGKAKKNPIIQAANRTKIWIEMTFENPEGCNVEKKSGLDCYKILAGKYGYKHNIATFYRFLKILGQNEARFNHSTKLAHVCIRILPKAGVITPTIIDNNREILKEDKNSEKSIIIVGVITPMAVPAKDNTKLEPKATKTEVKCIKKDTHWRYSNLYFIKYQRKMCYFPIDGCWSLEDCQDVNLLSEFKIYCETH